ncbi:hypothetical protein JANAI62_22150 [Jannaschia pagri]|uniref:Methyltransferase FkbM domain-containing protein n=1 Tax=Jannaschia pagri TaxID=2829797 RepID=A0ABQ4NNA4_9RHOB|nr:hypothetical protein JANAI61_22160 [Jannaschia sp. AI_61]GIT95592.1 hypothetical protein JANAI62_22150 [Jannaschia sp. AI_62]
MWSETGASLEFVSPRDAGSEFGSIATFADRTLSPRKKLRSDRYKVTTVSLNDLLDRHDAPEVIDYMSIDTEGSELDILRAFDFGPRKIRVMTVEHNYTPAREQIHDLLAAQGYTRVLEKASAFDDWYVLGDG